MRSRMWVDGAVGVGWLVGMLLTPGAWTLVVCAAGAAYLVIRPLAPPPAPPALQRRLDRVDPGARHMGVVRREPEGTWVGVCDCSWASVGCISSRRARVLLKGHVDRMTGVG